MEKIWENFGKFEKISENLEKFRKIWKNFGRFEKISENFRKFWNFLEHFWVYKASSFHNASVYTTPP